MKNKLLKSAVKSPWKRAHWNPASLEYSYFGMRGWTTVRLIDAEQQGGIDKVMADDLARCPDWSSNPSVLTPEEREMLDSTYISKPSETVILDPDNPVVKKVKEVVKKDAYDRAMKGL